MTENSDKPPFAVGELNAAPKILAWCHKCKALMDDECDDAGHPVVYYKKEAGHSERKPHGGPCTV